MKAENIDIQNIKNEMAELLAAIEAPEISQEEKQSLTEFYDELKSTLPVDDTEIIVSDIEPV
jgi:hypothetical protein